VYSLTVGQYKNNKKMSYHQIEDLVEDSIIIINNTDLSKLDKRDLIYNLYQFQYKFDTNNTLIRVRDILLKNHFLYSLPIKEHIDYSANKAYFIELDKDAQVWIPAYVDEPEKGSVYLSENKIWFEVNDEYWKRIRLNLPTKEQRIPKELSIINLLYRMLTLSMQQDNKLVAKRWYAAFVNSFLDFDLDENDGIPQNFNPWLNNKELKQLRKLLAMNLNILKTEDEAYEDDELFAIMDYKTELEFETNPDRRAQIKFLLDFQSSLEDIKTAFENEINYKVDLSKYELIYQYIREKLDSNWKDGIKEIKEEKGLITFLKSNNTFQDQGEEIHTSLIIDYTSDIKTIGLYVGIQNARILSWQGREASAKPEHQHFIENIFAHGNEEELEANKNISDWGGWKYDIKQNKKTHLKRLDSLWTYFMRYQEPIVKIYQEPLIEWVGNQDISAIKNQREQLLNKKVSFFGNEIDFALFIACLNAKQGYDASTETFIKEVENLLQEGMGSDQLKRRVRQGLTYISLGKGTYPEISNIYSYRLAEKS